jgi:hypothetical protein
MTHRRQPPKKQKHEIDRKLHVEAADDDDRERRDEGCEDAEQWRSELESMA